MMRAGRMDQRVTVQRVTATADGQGGFSESWTTVAQLWARVETASAAEGEQASQIVGTQSVKFHLRALPTAKTITAKDRIVWNGRSYDITTPQPFPAGRPERLEITGTARND